MSDQFTQIVSTHSHVRAFGLSRVDLDVDFNAPPPLLAVRVLESCIDQREHGENDVLQWSLAQRLQYLLQLVKATRGDALVLDVNCPHDDCRTSVELPIQLSWFMQPVADEPLECRVDEHTCLQLRLPNGYDQLAWMNLDDRSDQEALMARSLLLSVNNQPAGEIDVDARWLSCMEQTLETRDPLMTLELESDCPNCGRHFSLPLDLEQQLLSLLQQEQAHLYRQIHVLAQHYHWNENDIMDLSPRRRRYYLDLLQTTEDWS